jgi:hypothetical protein
MSSHQESLFGQKFSIFSQQSGTNQRLTAKRKTYQMSPFYSKDQLNAISGKFSF